MRDLRLRHGRIVPDMARLLGLSRPSLYRHERRGARKAPMGMHALRVFHLLRVYASGDLKALLKRVSRESGKDALHELHALLSHVYQGGRTSPLPRALPSPTLPQ